MSETTLTSRAGALAAAFDRAAREDRAALVLYTTAGYPAPAQGLDVLLALADAGADVLELGVPFSDPLADGPTIQRSSFAAIERGVDLAWTLELLRRFRRERETPVVLFSYLNPILDHGVDAFVRDAVEAGADGVLLTDLPLGADPALERAVGESPLDLIRLVAPTTSAERAREIARAAQGFLYFISRTGVTGAQTELAPSLEREVAALVEVSAVPVAVGFGVSSPEQVRIVAGVAAGVVVGSALVDLLGRAGLPEVRAFVAGLRAATGRRGPG
jgi:tryptophan synthase alpha chain